MRNAYKLLVRKLEEATWET